MHVDAWPGTKQNKEINVSKAVFEGKKGGEPKVYLDVRLLGLYYCDDDLSVTPKKQSLTGFHTGIKPSAASR